MSYDVTEKDIDRLFKSNGVEFMEIRLLKGSNILLKLNIYFANIDQ